MKQLIAALALLMAMSVAAQGRGKHMNEQELQRFRTEIRAYKHKFLAKELDLTQEQQRDFFAIYDEMDDEIEKINEETRVLGRNVAKKADASDVELEAAARAIYGQKKAEGEVELQYFDRFKQVLTPKQLFKLRHAERKFTRRLMHHHNNSRTQNESK